MLLHVRLVASTLGYHAHIRPILSDHLCPAQAWVRAGPQSLTLLLTGLPLASISLLHLRYLLVNPVSLHGIPKRGTDQIRSYEVVSWVN